jgi:phytoene dehydrogenase-like protein
MNLDFPLSNNADAIVIGSGPNGLSAAITLARAGLKVKVFEASEKVGGGVQSDDLTLPGFTHDVFSACYPMVQVSPFFKTVPLEKFGIKWIHSPIVVSHPLGGERAVSLYRSVEKTASFLKEDEQNYINYFGSLVSSELMDEILGPLFHFPKNSFKMLKFGLSAIKSLESFAKGKFQTREARALAAGIGAHISEPLTDFASAAPGLALHLAGHVGGWPVPEGGAKKLSQGLVAYFQSLGGEIIPQHRVQKLDDLPEAEVVLFDLTPKQILEIMGGVLPGRIRKSFSQFRYGAGVFKMDWALDGPIPWLAQDCTQSLVVHIGGSLEDIVKSEAAATRGAAPGSNPYVLLCQPSLFDSTRAPRGKHTVWAYMHVPHGSQVDYGALLESQIEKYAPGFQKLILKRSILNSGMLEKLNSNLIGGDISGGAISGQLFFRPRLTFNPYSLGSKKYWICSASTSPGSGVHGMCGHLAAKQVLKFF